MKTQSSLLALLLVAAFGCGAAGDADVVKPSKTDGAAKRAAPEAVPTAAGTMVMAFEFVDDMSPCANCIGKATKTLDGLPGIKKHDLEKGKQEFTVEFDPKEMDAATLAAALKPIGHDGVEPISK